MYEKCAHAWKSLDDIFPGLIKCEKCKMVTKERVK